MHKVVLVTSASRSSPSQTLVEASLCRIKEAVKHESGDFVQAALFLVVSLKIFMEPNLHRFWRLRQGQRGQAKTGNYFSTAP